MNEYDSINLHHLHQHHDRPIDILLVVGNMDYRLEWQAHRLEAHSVYTLEQPVHTVYRLEREANMLHRLVRRVRMVYRRELQVHMVYRLERQADMRRNLERRAHMLVVDSMLVAHYRLVVHNKLASIFSRIFSMEKLRKKNNFSYGCSYLSKKDMKNSRNKFTFEFVLLFTIVIIVVAAVSVIVAAVAIVVAPLIRYSIIVINRFVISLTCFFMSTFFQE